MSGFGAGEDFWWLRILTTGKDASYGDLVDGG